MIRCEVNYGTCPHCHAEFKVNGYCWDWELRKTWICGNCQIGKLSVRVVDSFEYDYFREGTNTDD